MGQREGFLGYNEGVNGNKCDSGSAEVQGGQVRVISVSKWDSGRGQVRLAVGIRKAVIEDREEVTEDRERVTEKGQGL